jgi:hypothetical protein
MTVEQIVDIPPDYRIFIDLPRSIPSGVKARVEISVSTIETKERNASEFTPSYEIEEVRRLLQKEMSERGTEEVKAASGEGWEAYIKERYAQP